MSGSYRRINYSLRPAKAIERKMLCDAFRRLYPFDNVENYRYVGFGSIYFADFHLFHRTLGISDMLSVEKDAYAEESFEFNKPYKCVHLDFRPASDVLPEMRWEKKTIVWLDYDGKLDDSVLSDIGTVCARACSGSLLTVSVNANVEHDPDETTRDQYKEEIGLSFELDGYRLRELRNRIVASVPPEVTGSDLRGKGLARVSRRIIQSTIEESLSARNAVLPPEKRFSYSQIFNFIYSDGALMLTIGGLLFEAGEQQKFDNCSFSALDFVRVGEEPYLIDVPCLTAKEMRHLNTQLPQVPISALAAPGVPPSDIRQYAAVYRYFPTYAEAIFS